MQNRMVFGGKKAAFKGGTKESNYQQLHSSQVARDRTVTRVSKNNRIKCDAKRPDWAFFGSLTYVIF